MNSTTKNRLWISLAAVTGTTGVFAVFDPLSWRLFPRCMLHSMTGMYCPGCGTGRALAQLTHGHWQAALRLNPVTVLALPLLGVLYVTGRIDRLKPVWIWTLLTFLIVFSVLRNLPWQPFTWLAPQP